MDEQSNLEQHTGTLGSQWEWGTESEKEFVADNGTYITFRIV